MALDWHEIYYAGQGCRHVSMFGGAFSHTGNEKALEFFSTPKHSLVYSHAGAFVVNVHM